MFRNKYTSRLLANIFDNKEISGKSNENINTFLNWYFKKHLLLNRMSSHSLEWQTFSPPQVHCFTETPIGIKMK